MITQHIHVKYSSGRKFLEYQDSSIPNIGGITLTGASQYGEYILPKYPGYIVNILLPLYNLSKRHKLTRENNGKEPIDTSLLYCMSTFRTISHILHVTGIKWARSLVDNLWDVIYNFQCAGLSRCHHLPVRGKVTYYYLFVSKNSLFVNISRNCSELDRWHAEVMSNINLHFIFQVPGVLANGLTYEIGLGINLNSESRLVKGVEVIDISISI